ncbi:hypothetical protein [Paenibacillus sp. ISL-20]|uniref:hypothetical protein n=1 Tax=Paenibacillus sp. ISL-20 TaxID=2819163 RepID=UPI001BE57C36|nr:hypothetical protein [Paenibacillus sp. ISL-20]MBT2761868.1 hypothetical protein [Paenibacillus sp. ISL-20]
MKTMHVDHKTWEEGGIRYEITKIYAPNDLLKPVHELERNYPVRFMTVVEGAIQSVMFGYTIAEKLAKKYRAKVITMSSNVPNVAEQVMGVMAAHE